jgi:sulfate adenylyltransferase subunit 1 (EFTu-like GTPase family)
MATGSSTADLAFVLVDARKGLLTQTRRHTYIAALFGIKHVVLAVNKMDLVDYSREVFEQIEMDYRGLAASLGIKRVTAIPLSGLKGDNVVTRSSTTPWYHGPALMEFLDMVEVGDDVAALVGAEVAVGDVDGDALLALGVQAVEQQRIVDVLALRAVASRIARQGGELVIEKILRLVQQAADQRALAVVHAAAGDEAQARLRLVLGQVTGDVLCVAHQK